MSIEEKPLHEVVLDIMFFADTEKPMAFTPEDVFWRMKDPDISERQIKEVLNWLVTGKKVVQRFGKYQIDKYEFVDMATKYEKEIQKKQKEEKVEQKKVQVVKKIAVKKQVRENEKSNVNLFKIISCFLLLLVMLLLVGAIYSIQTKPNRELPEIKFSEWVEYESPHLYVSAQENSKNKIVGKQLKNISFSFWKQNKTNQKFEEKLNSLNNSMVVLREQLDKVKHMYKEEQDYHKKIFTVMALVFMFLTAFLFLLIKKLF
ncbi:DUF5457 domain-containing protein [Tenacibaculum maritimum]|uniref:DUF5457 domain-containing protein n=1 Tax=Tenacibaculum maritimum TaxID=107401 RepID=UPI0012E4BEE4|nr:DUF5457 domain-containing protein [Tenacibaculum maritimum]MCD9582896.1 DUF5457 domain-containing protein [Tenacibaculum maritimum]MCD9637091.1 DUF5457 domain-containing protein [Tenacibaculum maritimum]CAA0239570.1 hypothetical protein USCSP91_520005 [Tenacibaculum maritimum]CAA0244687.1 hypothetical protein USCSE301_610005 [Tenacibaculum maritimum]